jgi:hypothetical protein
MILDFSQFLASYIDSWRSSSLQDLKTLISTDYQAREVTNGAITDFGYEESINGWEQGFQFVQESNAQWDLTIGPIYKLRDNEIMVTIAAGLIINGKTTETGNLFFQTFQASPQDQTWKLVRSYIEAGVSISSIR